MSDKQVDEKARNGIAQLRVDHAHSIARLDTCVQNICSGQERIEDTLTGIRDDSREASKQFQQLCRMVETNTHDINVIKRVGKWVGGILTAVGLNSIRHHLPWGQ